MKTKLTKLIAH